MSYNVLADELSTPIKFTYASEKALDFDFRVSRILREV